MKCISLQSGLLLLPFSILLFLSLEREPHLFFVFRCKYRHLQLKNVREYRTNKIQSSQPLTFMKNKWKTKSTLCCSSQAKYFKDEKVMARVWCFLKIKACFVYLLCNCCDCFAFFTGEMLTEATPLFFVLHFAKQQIQIHSCIILAFVRTVACICMW